MMPPVGPLAFVKYHGLGNDFIVVEGPPLMDPERAARLCDRRRGIGADGVLTVLPAEEGGAAFMHVYNPDGSVAAMCGNGIRCVARHLAETRGLELFEQAAARLESRSGGKIQVRHTPMRLDKAAMTAAGAEGG